MRRIKSAPENLSLMCHRRKKCSTSLDTILHTTTNNQLLKDDKKSIIEEKSISPFFLGLYYSWNQSSKEEIATSQKSNSLSNLFLSYNSKIQEYLLRSYQSYFYKEDNYKNQNMKKINHKFRESNTKLNNFKYIKEKKNIVNLLGTSFNDLITNNNLYLFDTSKLLELSVTYLSENIFRKDKLKELTPFVLQYFARYLISMFLHKYILFHTQLNIDFSNFIHF